MPFFSPSRPCHPRRAILFILGLLCLLTPGCGLKRGNFHESHESMGTLWEVTLVDAPTGRASQAMQASFDEIDRIDRMMSLFKPESELCQLNRRAYQAAVPVSPELWEILQIACQISDLSGGVFDVTIGPVVQLWGFAGQRRQTPPTTAEIARAKSLVNYRNLLFDPVNKTVRFRKQGMVIDLGGIAKGYAIDRVTEILKKRGIQNAMVNAGGQIKVTGHNEQGGVWKIGVQHPRDPSKLITVLPLAQGSFSTSGDYEHFFIYKGQMYHHEMDPKKGKPTREMISATVILDWGKHDQPTSETGRSGLEGTPSREATWADGLSTAVFVAGRKKGMSIVEKVKNADAVLIAHTPKGIVVSVSKGKYSDIPISY